MPYKYSFVDEMISPSADAKCPGKNQGDHLGYHQSPVYVKPIFL